MPSLSPGVNVPIWSENLWGSPRASSGPFGALLSGAAPVSTPHQHCLSNWERQQRRSPFCYEWLTFGVPFARPRTSKPESVFGPQNPPGPRIVRICCAEDAIDHGISLFSPAPKKLWSAKRSPEPHKWVQGRLLRRGRQVSHCID